MNGTGTLASEIQRRTAEIEDWPDWAKPYDQLKPISSDQGSTGSGSTQCHDSDQPHDDEAR
jgi:hypothetical protein